MNSKILMKKLKTYLKHLLVIIVITFAAVTCQKEEVIESSVSDTSPAYKVRILNYKDIHNTNVKQKVEKINQRKGTKTTGLNRENGEPITIDTTSVNHIIAENGYESYTFNILNSEDAYTIENLLVAHYGNDSVHAFLVTHHLQESLSGGIDPNQWDQSISHTTFLLLDETTEIEEASSMQSRGYSCITVWGHKEVDKCEGNLNPGPDCFENNQPIKVLQYIVIAEACGFDHEGGNSGGGGGTNPPDPDPDPNYGGGGGSTPTNPYEIIITAPNLNLATELIAIFELDRYDDAELISWIRNHYQTLGAGFDVTEIFNFLLINEFSVEAIDLAESAIEALADDECAILPTVLDLSEIEADFDLNLFGDYPAPAIQQNHDAIQQQFNNLRNTNGNLAAVNYLISTYNMNTFGPNSVNFNYSISFENGLSNGAYANAIRGFNSNGIMVSCNVEIDINLLSFFDFGYIARVIKHELLHVLQGEYYGADGLSNAAGEFDAYYSQIFRFTDLKQIQDWSIVEQLAKYLDDNMDQLSDSERAERQDMINRAKQQFPKICNDD